MKKIDFSNLKSTEFYVDKISSIYQIPRHQIIDVSDRKCNGFLVIEGGECVVSWSGDSQHLRKGGIIYLPSGSDCRIYAETEKFSFTRINFTTHDLNSEKFVFSDKPLVMCAHFDSEVMNIVHSMNDLFLDATASLKLKSNLYSLFYRIDGINFQKNSNPINHAVEYIERHYTENIDLKELVKSSYLSQATMYRTFKKETGMTPVEYKNHLRIQQAKSMLRTEEYTINEISGFLGFDSIYYFCRVFKQLTKMSPTQYRNCLCEENQ